MYQRKETAIDVTYLPDDICRSVMRAFDLVSAASSGEFTSGEVAAGIMV